MSAFCFHKFSNKHSFIYFSLTFMLILAAASAPTPLYQLFQSEFHFSTLMLTLIFSVYALSLLGTLLIAGSISDYVGRKPVVLASLCLMILAMMTFYFSNSTSHLLFARTAQGIGTALATSTLCAIIIEIDEKKGAKVNSFAPMTGMGLGMIITCSVFTFTQTPLKTVFLVLIILMVCALLFLSFTTETACSKKGALKSLRASICIPKGSRNKLAAISPINIALWMLSGFYLSLMPSLILDSIENTNIWVNGSAFLMLTLFASGATLIAEKIKHAMLIGIVLLLFGVTLILSGVNQSIAILILMGSMSSGIGFGYCFMNELSFLLKGVDFKAKGELITVFYIESYLAFCIPIILTSLAMNIFNISLVSAANLYGVFIMVLLISALIIYLKISNYAAIDWIDAQ